MLQRGDHRWRQPGTLDRQHRPEPCPHHRRRRRPTRRGEVGQRQRRPGGGWAERLGQRGHSLGCHPGDRRQERPLIGPRLHRRRVQEHRRAALRRTRRAAAGRSGSRTRPSARSPATGRTGHSSTDPTRHERSSPGATALRPSPWRRSPATRPSKNTHTCAPFPERDRSNTAGTPLAWQASR